jgi:hypothetical protein
MRKLSLAIILLVLGTGIATAQLMYGSEVTGNVMIPASSFSDAFSPGFGGTLGMFFDIEPNLRMTLSGGYLSSPVNESGIKEIYQQAGGTGTISPTGSARVIPLLLGLQLITPGPMRVFGGLEAGLYIYSVDASATITDNTGSANVSLANETRTEFGVNLGFGGLMPINESMSLVGNVKYHFVKTSEFRSSAGGASQVTLSTNQFLSFGVGLNWAFPS